MRKSQISASMMCSNLVDLQATIDVFEKEKVEYLHIDVMDGEFVPNFGLGVDYIRGLRELTSIPLDLHLMIKDPEYKLPWIGIYKEDIVTIHYESTFQVQRALDYLVPYGCKRFLAINPATPIGQIEAHLVDAMKVFAGQRHRNRGHLTPRRLLGFGNGRANRFHGKLHILHAAVLDAERGDLAEPQKREFSAFGSVGHGHRNLFRTDVERGDG